MVVKVYYKQCHSIVLMAIVDTCYKIIIFDVEVNGRHSGAGVFASSHMSCALEDNTLHIPPDKPLPGRDVNTPYVIVGDEAFPLKHHVMKPYPEKGLTEEQRIFNYRLSRARRVSENCFGIMVNRLAVLGHEMSISPEKSNHCHTGMHSPAQLPANRMRCKLFAGSKSTGTRYLAQRPGSPCSQSKCCKCQRNQR